MNIDFPFRVGADGRTGTCDDAKHVRDMIKLLLFTNPGERVMRPEFGTGLLQFVFAPNSDELGAALQLTLQGALDQWLGDVIDVRSVVVESEEATLRVSVEYVLRASGEARTETFTRSAS